jgi:hypothetical protein
MGGIKYGSTIERCTEIYLWELGLPAAHLTISQYTFHVLLSAPVNKKRSEVAAENLASC